MDKHQIAWFSMAKEPSRLSDQLREAIDASGMSRYSICKTLDVDQGLMSRFMAGKAGLSVETIDKLGDLLGLQLVTTKKPATGKGR
jgi:plasmid maintenance system antidote protein VapI